MGWDGKAVFAPVAAADRRGICPLPERIEDAVKTSSDKKDWTALWYDTFTLSLRQLSITELVFRMCSQIYHNPFLCGYCYDPWGLNLSMVPCAFYNTLWGPSTCDVCQEGTKKGRQKKRKSADFYLWWRRKDSQILKFGGCQLWRLLLLQRKTEVERSVEVVADHRSNE